MKEMMNKLYNIICVGCAALTMASCVDTVILPDDKTVDEDFWKSKSDVALMLNGAYKSMLSDNVIARLIVWGGLRSDELLPNTQITGTLMENLRDINLANTQTDNQFVKWDAFYSVINNCNIVLDRAEAVTKEDPSYTEGDYLADRSQMLALRSLCYFYLVRNYRDIPYIATAFMSDSQERSLPLSTPDVVLENCINDLQEAERNAVSSSAYADWRRVGYMTRDAIQALLADIYLWRGSVMHSNSDYQQAIAYCDKVIASKKAQHVPGRGEVENVEYPLAEGREMFAELFVLQNAEESIFELQFDGENNPSIALQQYFKQISSSNASPYLYAPKLFKKDETIYPKTTNGSDWRGYNTYTNDKTVDEFEVVQVRKYVSKSTQIGHITGTELLSYNTKNQQNYIVYRLTDVMLMKAEALAALALLTEQEGASDSVDVEHLRLAFNLVQTVNARSLEVESDSLKWDTYKNYTAEGIEGLVLNERLRELAFEGKRWYDLLRYNYRHSEGVDYGTLLADQQSLPKVYQPMLDLMVRKLSSKGSAVASKTNTEARLYLPIPEADLKLSPLWRQNPSYGSSDTFSKN